MKAMHRPRPWPAVLAPWVLMLALGGCAGLLPGDPPRVDVVGVQPLEGQGLELRMLVRLRVVNPNDEPIDYDGVFVELDVRGKPFASGVSNASGTVPRYGEAVLSVPVTVPAFAMVRQAMGMAQGDSSLVTYQVQGKLSSPQWRNHRFSSQGEFRLPREFTRDSR